AQLLHFAADLVRPQGRAAGGMAGIKLGAAAEVIWFGAVSTDPANIVVTVAGASAALPGTDLGSVKVSAWSEYPAKGRATGGVRVHRFLRGEDRLTLAWAGPPPGFAAGAQGGAVPLPTELGKRDGSGTALARRIFALGSGRPLG
ncbi:MAG: DNA gyrase C-terminal beta-propeller domain-containing protein, partial [Angustibacter sp.]